VNLAQLLEVMAREPELTGRLTAWETIPAREPDYVPYPSLDGRLVATMRERGIEQLYRHQGEAVEHILSGRDTIIVTPTASGKSLCYNLPVLNRLLQEPEARALFLFPTKALAQDQRAELESTVDQLGVDIKTYTYDGDTPADARSAIRSAGHIVITNPDMLHTGILPHHTKWVRLFENLRYVVIDELHQYRGVFGSHVACVLRRLLRVARFYGSRPVFVCCSATIANPRELAERLTGRSFALVDRNGAPAGEKHILFYNPPLVNRQLGIRRSSLLEGRRLARRLLANGVQTIVFARSRLQVEVLLSYLREGFSEQAVRGYRGGYLPRERRAIERGLREGSIRGVVSTNALELGVDIGSLQASVLIGYPGSISSAWQQMGRAGRRSDVSLAVMVASSSPLDQHIISQPDYFFRQSPEHGLINPENLFILVSHVKCAAFELPFRRGERLGEIPVEEILDYLAERRVLHRSGDQWFWMADNFPAEDISLRSAAAENFVVVDISSPEHRIIGEVDEFSAPMLIHEEAIYLHEGRQFQVERLDFSEKKAYVRQVEVNYFTDAQLAVQTRVLDVFEQAGREGGVPRWFGEVMLTAKVTMFKKIRFGTHENVGWGKIHLPEREMHTTAFWLGLPPEVCSGLGQGELEAAVLGLRNLLAEVAPLYLLCDRHDLHAVAEIRSPFTEMPTVFLCDAYPGGVGFGEKLYSIWPEVLRACHDIVLSCPCDEGCPSCVGPRHEVGELAKEATHRILTALEAQVRQDES